MVPIYRNALTPEHSAIAEDTDIISMFLVPTGPSMSSLTVPTMASLVISDPGNHGKDLMQCMPKKMNFRQCVYADAQRVMTSEKPSTHCPHEPETPAMLYPRGGIKVCLKKRCVSEPIG